MILNGMMEIFHQRPELRHFKNSFLLQPPNTFQQRSVLMQQPPLPPPPAQPEKPTTSFLISDILSGNVGKSPGRDENIQVMQPWDSGSSRSSSPDLAEDEEIDVGEERPKTRTPIKGSPLDALLKMTNKSFDGTDTSGLLSNGETHDQMNGLFSKAQPSKKRRKSRTAFSNHQIYELEKRFLYQKYLTPADRDEIAQKLGLSNAQVITWFQNRRAKLKRDLEELKADMSAAKIIGKEPHSVLTRLEEMQAYTTRQSLIKWEKRTLKMKGECPPGFNPLSLLDENSVPLNMVNSPEKHIRSSKDYDGHEKLPTKPDNESSKCPEDNEDIREVHQLQIEDHSSDNNAKVAENITLQNDEKDITESIPSNEANEKCPPD